MNRGPIGGKAAKDHRETVVANWGEDAPGWVVTLAEQCCRSSQTAVGKELGYSSAVISTVLANKYGGDMGRIKEMVEGRFMASIVNCPVLGEIGLDVCLTWQKKPFAATSSHRVQVYRACRRPCEHFTQKGHGGEA